MRVAIVHDDLVQFGGAERVLEGICEIFPDAPIYTSLFDKDNESLRRLFSSKEIITSFLQKIPGWKSLYKAFLPLYPIAFEQFDFSKYDLVISQTTRFAKSIITKPHTKHISYCHTPPRFLWHFSDERNDRIKESLFSYLRVYDQVSAKRVDYFIAGSKNAQKRIKKIYHQNANVVYPYLDLERFSKVEPFDGGYFLTIARLAKYKSVDLAVRACGELNISLKVVGSGPELQHLRSLASSNYPLVDIEFYDHLSDKEIVLLLSGAKGLIIPGMEDFGLTAIEAQAVGKPVIAYKAGGVLETVIEGKTGLFFNIQEVQALKQAIMDFQKRKFYSKECKENASQYSKERFINRFKYIINRHLNF